MSGARAGGSSLLALLGGAALGAVAMYLSDPDRGRRRRAIARDKVQSLMSQTRSSLDVASRDLGNRIQGMRAQADRMLRRRKEEVDDDVLVARVRSRIGRAISHPHAVKVRVEQGCVHLSGPILPDEKKALLMAVRSVHGVTSVEDHTEVHETADLPSLQGEGRTRSGARLRIMRDNWPPGLRAVATLGGGALGLMGVIRRTPASLLLGAVGIGLAARGLTNAPLMRSASHQGEDSESFDLFHSVHIAAAPEVVYEAWRNYENFPRFMSNVQEVRDLGDGRSHWVVSGPAGVQLEWTAYLTTEDAGRCLAWQTEPESSIEHRGEVRFEPEENGTRVAVRMSYQPQMPLAEEALASFASLFNGDPTRQMAEDLRRMKEYVEGNTSLRSEPGADSQPGQTLH